MKILLSPAKSIKLDIEAENPLQTQPVFLSEAEKLVKKLKKLKPKHIKTLMKVSDDIAELNYNRFNAWHLPFTSENSKASADIFSGAAYQGLNYPTLTEKERIEGQNRLRILSGLYGVLKPLDLIQPYRLEMGTRFQVTPKIKNLYQFWDTKINHFLNDELAKDNHPFLVNLASAEYFKAAKLNAINFPVITPIFKDRDKNGDYKVIMTYTKKARGLMSRFIIKNKIDNIEDLKGFDYEDYCYFGNEKDENELVFVRG
jgi:cytoplasmic iron level regulating protein YaaA (DUF328/UPF0246 family)